MSVYWLFGALVACLVVAVVWATLRSVEDPGDDGSDALRLDGALEALRALEFERETGKVSDGEYGRLRARLEAEAVRARDAAASGSRLGTAAAAGSGEGAAGAGAARACGTCGRSLEGTERFCPSCGGKVPAPAALGERDTAPDAPARE